MQMSSTHNMKNEAIVGHQSVIDALYDTEEHMSTMSAKSAESSLSLGMDGIGIVGKQIGPLPAEYMERLLLLSSNARSWRVSDDEAVDLTEPRFEYFHIANFKSP